MKKITFLLHLFLLLAINAIAGTDKYFIPNAGQITDTKGEKHPEIKFKHQGDNTNLYFTQDRLIYHFIHTEEKNKSEYSQQDLENYRNGNLAAIGKKVHFFRLDLEFLGANKDVRISSSEALQSYSNFYLPSCPDGLLNLGHYGKITYENLYEGIDMVFYFQDGNLKYDFIVAPGADVSQIKMRYAGADNIEKLESGELLIKTPVADLIEGKPYSYNSVNRQEIESQYSLEGNVVSYDLKSAGSAVVIDPSVTWSTYFNNGSSSDTWTKPDFDATGAFYNTGYTYYTTFPVLNAGAGMYFDSSKDGITDLVVVKFSASRSYAWSTYYGGDGGEYVAGYTDYGRALAVEGTGVYFAGQTDGTIFPTHNPGGGAFYQDQTRIFSETSFIVRLNSSGVREWATIFQHENPNTMSGGFRINGINVGNGKLYFTGQSYRFNSNDIPLRTLSGAYNNGTWKGPQDVFIGRFNSSNQLEWSSYLNDGGLANASYRQGCDLTMDATGNLWFVGRHTSNAANAGHLILNQGGGAYYQGFNNGDQDLIITKFNSSLVPVHSTYYGGNDQDIPAMIECNSSGDAVVVLRAARSTNFPVYDPGGSYYQPVKAYISSFDSDAAIIKFNSASQRQWATYYGGSGGPSLFSGVGFDASNNIYVFGSTQASNFPVQNDGVSYYDGLMNGSGDVVLLKFNNMGARSWATFFGGSGYESLYSPKGEVMSSGCTLTLLTMPQSGSTDYPTVNPGGGAFYETTALTANVNAILLLEEANASALSTAPNSASATTATICVGGSTTLSVSGGSLGTGASWAWYSGSCGGSLVGLGASITVSPLVSTTYYVRAEGTCNTTSCASVSVTVLTNSTAPSSASASTPVICTGSSTTLSVSGGSLGSGASWAWYTGSCGGTLVGTGASLSVNPTSTTTYFVRAEGTCNTTTCQSVTVTVNTFSTAATSATASIPTICPGNSTTLSVTGGSLGSGANWTWYTGSCGGTIAGTGASVSVSPAATTTYFVRAEGSCNTTTCVSVTVTVNTVSSAPASASASTPVICTGSSTTLSVSGGSLGSGATWAWYSGSCGGTLVGTGASLSVSPTSTTTYFVRAEGSCNTTSCQSVTVTVNTLSTAATSAAASIPTICPGNSTTLSVSGGSLGSGANWTWYTGSCGGTIAGTGTSVSVSPASTTTYFVRAEGSCNTTACVSVTVTVNTLSTDPTSANASASPVCPGAPVTLSVSGGSLGTMASWAWYTGSCGGSLVGTGTSISVNPASSTTYYVRAEGSCNTTACATVTVNVNTVSTAPASITTPSTNICHGASAVLTVSGGSLGTGASFNWYSGSCGGTLIGTGSSITVTPGSTTSYFVRAEGTCNTTACAIITLTLSSQPLSANATANNVTCFGGSNGTVDLVVSGGAAPFAYAWSNGQTTEDLSSLQAGTYSLTVTDNFGCTTTASATVSQPSAALSGDTTAVACDNFTWYGTTYTSSAEPVHVFTSMAGCDSTVTLHLTILNSSASSMTATACDSYTLNGITYASSGSYQQTLVNAAGCDSILTLNLTINQSTSGTLNVTACDSYTLNSSTYTSSGSYTQLLVNAAGCDSTLTLNLTLGNSSSATITETACGEYTLNGTTYTSTGIYTQSLVNAAGCDSTLTIDLTVNTIDNGVTMTGASLTANSTTATYQWLDCNNGYAMLKGETNTTYNPSVNGSYAVMLTENGCTDTSDCYNVTSTGIETLQTDEMVIYPNPAGSEVNLNIGSNKTQNASLIIFNVSGAVVMREALYLQTGSNIKSLNTHDLARGVYHVQVVTEDKVIVKKLILN
jgi:hypothetical protein